MTIFEKYAKESRKRNDGPSNYSDVAFRAVVTEMLNRGVSFLPSHVIKKIVRRLDITHGQKKYAMTMFQGELGISPSKLN